MKRWIWGTWGLVTALLIVSPLVSGRLVQAPVGISMFYSAGGFGLVFALCFGIAAAIGAARGRPWWRQAAAGATAPFAVAVAVVLGILVFRGGPSERFNDVTTDLADPPIFAVGPAAGAPYPERFRPMHQRAYPELRSVVVAEPPQAVFARARAIAAAMPGWEVLHEDADGLVIQALARTPVFRLEDDVVIRVRAQGSGGIVDLRSKSRFGGGDRGANEARISVFLARLTASDG